MSIDIVDDLHAAEDYGETLRVAARKVVQASDLPDIITAIQELDLASEDRFVRPSCEEIEDGECRAGEDCGGFHPWVLGP